MESQPFFHPRSRDRCEQCLDDLSSQAVYRDLTCEGLEDRPLDRGPTRGGALPKTSEERADAAPDWTKVMTYLIDGKTDPSDSAVPAKCL